MPPLPASGKNGSPTPSAPTVAGAAFAEGAAAAITSTATSNARRRPLIARASLEATTPRDLDTRTVARSRHPLAGCYAGHIRSSTDGPPDPGRRCGRGRPCWVPQRSPSNPSADSCDDLTGALRPSACFRGVPDRGSHLRTSARPSAVRWRSTVLPSRAPCAKIGPSRTARRGGIPSWACVRLRRSRTPRPATRHAVHVGSRTIARQAGGAPRSTARRHAPPRAVGSGPTAVGKEEPHHLRGRVGAHGVGVGPDRAAAEPGVPAAVHGPGLDHDGTVGVGVDRAGGGAGGPLVAFGPGRDGAAGGGHAGGDELVGVHRGH